MAQEQEQTDMSRHARSAPDVVQQPDDGEDGEVMDFDASALATIDAYRLAAGMEAPEPGRPKGVPKPNQDVTEVARQTTTRSGEKGRAAPPSGRNARKTRRVITQEKGKPRPKPTASPSSRSRARAALPVPFYQSPAVLAGGALFLLGLVGSILYLVMSGAVTAPRADVPGTPFHPAALAAAPEESINMPDRARAPSQPQELGIAAAVPDGTSSRPAAGAEAAIVDALPAAQGEAEPFCGSRTSDVFHRADCLWAERIAPANRVVFATREAAVRDGRRACDICAP